VPAEFGMSSCVRPRSASLKVVSNFEKPDVAIILGGLMSP